MRNIKLSWLVTLSFCFALFSSNKADSSDLTYEKMSISKYLSALEIKGDIRLRQENFWKGAPNAVDRSRQRFRFRLGITPTIQDVRVLFRLASGTGETVSTNQSFDNLSSQKDIYIDQAAVEWKGLENFKVIGGRMPNPFWGIYSSDLVWDTDYNPEGFAEQISYSLTDRVGVFGNFAQIVLDEDSSSNKDQWMYGFQVGVKTRLFNESHWNIAFNYIDLENELASNFGQTTTNEGNSRNSATLVSSSTYKMLHLTNEFKSRIGPWPMALQADYVVNKGDRIKASQAILGYQVGAILNQAKKANSWELAYFYKYSETDATLADIADSDFGDGGTNRKGHIAWIGFNPRDYIELKAKLFVTETIDSTLAPGYDPINRLQLDLGVKF